LTKGRRQDIPASSKFESKEDFVGSVESVLGKKGDTGRTRHFSEKVYGDLKAKGVDENRMRLIMGVIKENKEDITTWLEDGEKTESDMKEASQWLMNQVDRRLQRRNEPFADARRQLEREMGPRGTGETRA
jgi:3-oxoacyl-ACP reductase-like protein